MAGVEVRAVQRDSRAIEVTELDADVRGARDLEEQTRLRVPAERRLVVVEEEAGARVGSVRRSTNRSAAPIPT